MSELTDLAEQALFAVMGLLRDIALGTPEEEINAKGQRWAELFERVRHTGATRDEVQRKQDRKRRTYQAKKLKLGKATS